MLSIALFHFHVTQIKRGAGQSAIASAAYRAGEKLHSEYYGEISDYTRKGGVICSEILLPSHAPPEYADRETLWNAVEKAERGKKAQLAYSFDIALQNEFSMQENIALARQFLLENFVSRGMMVDFAVHSPDKEDASISNPHFHVMCPIRPLDEHGRWGNKQRREYVLDEHGERILDEAGNYVFNAVPTTDWGKPETLEEWRQAWADLCNAKFAEKGLDCQIDHRSYERQGIEQIPTVHGGPSVRAMKAKGIRTDKGDFNRWVRKTNAMLREAKNKIASLLEWLKAVKEELSKPQPPMLNDLLMTYYNNRNKGAYSTKAKTANLQRYADCLLYTSYGVNCREAAERYGVSVNRQGKALCPFHNDRHPSLYAADDHYHCFACGEHGDVIDFAAKLFGLPLYEAAQRLAADFHLTPDKPPSAAALHAKRIRTCLLYTSRCV